MSKIKFNDVTMIYPFIKVKGILDRKQRELILQKQKEMPYLSNEGVVAVQHFSVEINDGEFVVILGPSGSGKTTILRMLAGLEKPSLGEIYFDSEKINSVKPEDRDMAMVFQNYSLYPNQNVYENIAFPLQNQHMPREEIDVRVKGMIDLVGLTNKDLRLPEELSGGEKQRVAIARALVRKPKVFLLDEPFSNLDEKMKSSLRRELKTIQKECKIPFIYVTHDQKDALLLADRIIVMKDGILQQNDTVSKIYNEPKNMFVAEFVGFPKMNIFKDIPIQNNQFVFMGKSYALNKSQTKRFRNKKSLIVGVRPSHIVVSNDGIKATIDYTEMIGSDFIIHAYVDEEEIVIAEKNDGKEENSYFHSQEIYLKFMDEYFYLFDDEGEGVQ